MKLFLIVVAAALALVGVARGSDVRVATLSAVEDVSLPFWCDWGYDWDERCYREDGLRLALGGEADKVWRSALRFRTASLPAGASILTAELSLWYDGTCVAPRKTIKPCDGRAFEFAAHPIFTPRWFAEREVDIGPQAGGTNLPRFASSQWVVWDLTDLIAEWVSGGLTNNGVLLKLAEGQEDYGSSGPLFPSTSYGNALLRPRLTVWYLLD